MLTSTSTANTPAQELPPLNLMYPEQLDVLSTSELAHYVGRVAGRYKSLQAAYEDEGIDTREEMLALGSHLAMITQLMFREMGE